MRRAWAVLALITIMAAGGCGMTESATPLPEVIVVTATPDVQATVDAKVAAAVRQTREAVPPTPKPYPTLQATPTLIPVPTRPPEPSTTTTAAIVATVVPPTATLTPENPIVILFPTTTPEGHTAPRPTATLPAWLTPEPQPTATDTPWPTPAPWPTPTPTPWPTPTFTPWPTATPAPTKAFERFGVTEYFPYEVWLRLDKAQKLFEQGDYQGSIRENQRVLDMHDQPSAVIQNDIGWAYAALRDYDAAIRHYNQYIQIRDDGVIRSNRAQSYYWTGQCRLAKQDAEIILSMEEASKGKANTHQNAHEVLYLCYQSEENFPKAIYHINETIQFAVSLRQKELGSYLASLSELHYQNSNCVQTKNAAEEALAITPYSEPKYHSHAEAHLWIALCLTEESKWDEALSHAEDALSLAIVAGYNSDTIDNLTEMVEALR